MQYKKSEVKVSFLLYKGPYGYFFGRHFFGSPLQMTPSFNSKEEALAYKQENNLNELWDEIVKFPKTYDPFYFDEQNTNITQDDIKEALGMKEVVIGNGYNNVSFYSAVYQTLNGFKKLADFIGVNLKSMGLNKTLSMKAGTTQGKVSGTSVFLKSDNFIRITSSKDKGATLARAWFDSVNFYLGARTGTNEFLPNLIHERHDENKFKSILGTQLYSAYQDLVEHLYFSTMCNMVKRTQKCYPRGYCVYATPEIVLSRCLEEYVKSNTSIKDNILSTRKTESDFASVDPIFKYESHAEFNRYPYPTSSEKEDVLPLAKNIIENIANFLEK